MFVSKVPMTAKDKLEVYRSSPFIFLTCILTGLFFSFLLNTTTQGLGDNQSSSNLMRLESGSHDSYEFIRRSFEDFQLILLFQMFTLTAKERKTSGRNRYTVSGLHHLSFFLVF